MLTSSLEKAPSKVRRRCSMKTATQLVFISNQVRYKYWQQPFSISVTQLFRGFIFPHVCSFTEINYTDDDDDDDDADDDDDNARCLPAP